MKNINWLKISSITAVIGLVLISLFTFTAFLRHLPDFKLSLTLSFLISLISTVSAIYYFSKTNYGDKDEINNNKE